MSKDKKFISENMADIISKLQTYKNSKENGDADMIYGGFYTAFVEVIIEKAKEDHDILKQYIDLINSKNNPVPGNNERDLTKL